MASQASGPELEDSVLLNWDLVHQIWEDAHGVLVSQDTPATQHKPYALCMERFLLLWDDMDDWLSAAWHLIGRRMA